MDEVSHDQRLDALLHDDFWVRSKILTILSHDRVEDIRATKNVIAAWKAHGWNKAFDWPHQIAGLPHDDESVEWLIEYLSRKPAGTPDAEALEREYLFRWLAEAPAAMLVSRLERIEAVASESGSKGVSVLLETAKRRVELMDMPGDECLRLLEDCLAACVQWEKDGNDFPRVQVSELQDLTEALATRTELDDATILDWLNSNYSEDPKIDDYRAGAGILLAGRRRIETAADRLIELLDYDWDWWDELCSDALAAMNSPAVQGRIVERYAALEWGPRLRLTSVLERLRFPEWQDSVIALLEREPDADLQVFLGGAVARYGNRKALAAARSVCDRYPRDPECHEILETLHAFHTLLGDQTEDVDKIRNLLENERRRQAKHAKRYSNLLTGLTFAEDDDDNDEVDDELTLAPPPESKPKPKRNVLPEGRPVTPVPEELRNVGRNDPCPCGSGKKYKKCCLRS